jgi:hypothetical protein
MVGMNAVTMDEVQCDVRSLDRWISGMSGKSAWKTLFHIFAIADRALEIAEETKACIYSCPRIGDEGNCLPMTITSGARIARGLRGLSRATFFVRFLAGDKFGKAADAWDELVENAEDILAMVEAERDASPLIPWAQVKSELGL